jgi:hypothetical protein
MPNTCFPIVTITRPTGPMSAVLFGMIDPKKFMIAWNIAGIRKAMIREADYCKLHDLYFLGNEFEHCPKCTEMQNAKVNS